MQISPTPIKQKNKIQLPVRHFVRRRFESIDIKCHMSNIFIYILQTYYMYIYIYKTNKNTPLTRC